MSGMPQEAESAAAGAARRLAAAGAAARHRYALVLSGQREWAVAAAGRALAAAALRAAPWVTDGVVPGAETWPAERARLLLGRELDAVVFDAFAGFHADAFGAVSGTIRAGGLLLLLTPPLAEWPGYADPDYRRFTVAGADPATIQPRFLRRMVAILREEPAAVVLEQGGGLPRLPPAGRPAAPVAAGGECRTRDQRAAVEAIVRVARGRSRRPLVMTSDRGRGKSSALGIAAARLLRQGVGDIRVTGPRLPAVGQVFAHAARLLPEARSSHASVRLGQAAITYSAPDALVRTVDPPPRLLLVDEAAAIPTPLLTRMLERYPRIVFATTQHGYEGTGRGFALRFQRILEERSPGWHSVRLDEPVRWAPGDPLERLVDRILLLSATAAPDMAVSAAGAGQCEALRLDRDQLAGSRAELEELFGLLVIAHYRTRPFDLRLLLDAPNVEIYAMRFQGHVVATALVAREGGLSPELARRIWSGDARPHGHLLPETLAAHAGLRHAPLLRGARIMRIAVHPALRRGGLGRRLVETIAQRVGADGCDYLGSSFGATVPLLRFWLSCDLRPVRVAVTRGASSGEHSAVVMRPLRAPGGELCHHARRRYLDELPLQLAGVLRDLEPPLVGLLLQRPPGRGGAALAAGDWEDLVACGFGRRLPETCTGPLWRLTVGALTDPEVAALLASAERDLLVLRVLQHASWSEVADALGVDGRAAATATLRAAVRKLTLRLADPATLALARSLPGVR